jgi:FtsZ-interacting cell division protein ZipA
MLIPMALASILALGGLFTILIVVGIVALLAMAGYAIWKMRSDDFWDQQ